MQCRLILVWMVAISLTMAQQSNAKPFTISGPPVAESCCFAIMTAKNLVPEGIKMEFIPWHSPDQARALVASGRVDAMITSSSGAAVFNQKGIKTKIAGLFNPPVWVVSAKSMALPGPLQGTLLFPFGHKEMPELIFDIVYGHPPELDGRHTGGSMEAVNLLLAGKADHALLAEPAASIAVVRSAKGPVPLVKHRDISKDWSTKFDGRPLFVSAFAVFGEALDRKEDVQAAIKGYTVARLWMINHPEEALALIRKIMPVMAPQVGEALPLSPGVTMETNENAFSSAFFFMNRIYQTSPKSMGESSGNVAFYEIVLKADGITKMKKHFFQTGGLLLLLAAWQIAAVSSSGLVVATPWATFKAAIAYMVNPEFIAHHLCLSLYRMGAALLAAILSGGVLGLISGLFPNVRSLIEPFRWVLTTVPGVVVVMVFMLWFGMGDLMVISIAACMGAPVIYINVADAVALADRELMEMARVYRFPPIMRLVNIYGMAVAGPFFCALVLSAGVTIRVVVLAEVLGANEGIGYYLAIARAQLDTPELYALALISMAVVGGIEYCILRPLERRLIWKGGSNVAQA